MSRKTIVPLIVNSRYEEPIAEVTPGADGDDGGNRAARKPSRKQRTELRRLQVNTEGQPGRAGKQIREAWARPLLLRLQSRITPFGDWFSYGTPPAAELFHTLSPKARNEGELDIAALIAGRPQEIITNEDGEYMLFRVGDAVASRNIHAAIYDSLRLCKEF
ncbi:MAG: hypothetical protein OXC55_06260 [Chloroflexi bacterium]|nr:hypothetical protein [Chloroflexota bacterium]